jgi:hypothetical protein
LPHTKRVALVLVICLVLLCLLPALAVAHVFGINPDGVLAGDDGPTLSLAGDFLATLPLTGAAHALDLCVAYRVTLPPELPLLAAAPGGLCLLD